MLLLRQRYYKEVCNNSTSTNTFVCLIVKKRLKMDNKDFRFRTRGGGIFRYRTGTSPRGDSGVMNDAASLLKLLHIPHTLLLNMFVRMCVLAWFLVC